MPEEDNKILKYNHSEKPMMLPFVIYFDFESLLEKIDTCRNDLEKSSTTKINKHTPSSYSLFTDDNDDKNNYKVKYHCHYTGKYRGCS